MANLWYYKNKDKAKQLAYDWQRNNREKWLAYKRKWNKEHKVELAVKRRKWYKKNREHSILYAKLWAEANADKRKAYKDRHRHLNYVWVLKHRYGMTMDDYNALLSKQGKVCAICKKLNINGHRLLVDHDHDTGAVRGLLCTRCNNSLGALGDNVAGIKSVLAYLEKSEHESNGSGGSVPEHLAAENPNHND